jgi:hypothetical protein
LRGLNALDGAIRGGRGDHERFLGLTKRLLQLGSRAQAQLEPVGQLVANIVKFSTRQLHRKRVRGGPLGQRCRSDQGHAESFNRPGNEEAPAFRRLSRAGHDAIAKLDGEPARGPIKARDVRLAVIGFLAIRFVRREPELHYPHGTLSAQRDRIANKDGWPTAGKLPSLPLNGHPTSRKSEPALESPRSIPPVPGP